MGRWCINHTTALLLVSAAHACGDLVVDQTFEPDASFLVGEPASSVIHAQTFTVAVTGVLKHIDAPIVVPPSGAILWEVRGTTNRVPSDEILASGSLPGYLRVFTNSYFEWVRFSLPEPGIAVRPGDVLALALRSTDSLLYLWSGSADDPVGDPYAHGAHFVLGVNDNWTENTTADAGFRTHVEVDALPQGYPTMSGPRRLGAQWQFSVSGDSNHVYVFERSRDLQIWEPIFTNASRVESRIFTVPDSPAPEFYRARVAKRENTFALVVLGNIDNGLANLQLDSFDSSDPRFSTSGQYDPLKKKAAGDLGLFGSLTSASRLVRVYGQAWLSRNTTNFSLSPQSSIGDSLWLDAGNAGIQPGHLRQDLDGIYPTPRRPSAGGLAPVGGVVNGEFYQFVLGDGFWVLPDLVLTSSNNMLVTGRATLHVRGDINVAGQARIQLQSPASRLTIYAEGYTSLAGQGVVGAARPENFVYYGVGSNRQLAIRFSPFVGVIYAPQTECWVRPALTQRLDIIGSCVVKTLRLWDSVNIHLDESLQQVVLY